MSFILLVEQVAPQTPSANQVILYPKSDGRMYVKDDAGTELQVSGQLGIVAGTRMLFQQTTAPSGWTKEVSATYNDAALRFQTGTVTTGGAAGFIATMNAAGATATDGSGTSGGFTLTTTEMPSHTHPADTTIGSGGVQVVAEAGSRASSLITGATGGGGSHSHSTPTHSHVLNSFNLKFVDCIIATKD